jgi:hypothetical protein
MLLLFVIASEAKQSIPVMPGFTRLVTHNTRQHWIAKLYLVIAPGSPGSLHSAARGYTR